MKTKLQLPLVVIAILLLLSACSSVPSKARLTSDDCLIVVKTGVVRPPNTDIARTYSLVLTDSDNVVKIPKKTSGMIYLKVRNNQTQIENVSSKITDPNYTGKSSNDTLGKQLPYSPGQLIAADYKIVQRIEKTAANRYVSSIDFLPITENERKEILAEAENDPELKSWFE